MSDLSASEPGKNSANTLAVALRDQIPRTWKCSSRRSNTQITDIRQKYGKVTAGEILEANALRVSGNFRQFNGLADLSLQPKTLTQLPSDGRGRRFSG